ncbi:MAG TPA: DUF1345 domain-containing protein [Albitalea sp.]|nr:DUF1345 domain-containing protein [Albitalea sp.]
MKKALANHLQARPRMYIAFAVGVAAAFVVPDVPGAVTRALIGWNVGVWLYLVLIAQTMLNADHHRLRRNALAHAEGAATVMTVVLAAAIASLVAIVVELASVKAAGTPPAWPQIALTLATVSGSWLLVPTLFTLDYAREYYVNADGSGFVFPGADADFHPDYTDFAYFAFTIAVASQTADVAITTRPLRRLVLVQSVLSFVFNATILAFTINIAASLF